MKSDMLEARAQLVQLFELYGSLLPTSQKQVFHLYYYEDLSLGEIAKIMATSRQAINDALKKAKNKLISIDQKIPRN